MSEIVDRNDKRVASFFDAIKGMSDDIQWLTETHRPTLNGERYLTDRELSERLKISRRTLQDYRNEGRISFLSLGGKILYKESDVQKVLDKNYNKAFE